MRRGRVRGRRTFFSFLMQDTAFGQLFERALSFLQRANHARIRARKLRRLERELAEVTPSRAGAAPERIQSVLLIDPLYCFGDGLFVNGLLHCLSERGLEAGIVTFPQLAQIYCTVLPEERIWRIDDEKSSSAALARPWDIAADLCYMFNQRWDVRKNIVRDLRAYSITIDRSIGESRHRSLYSEYLDVSHCAHFGDRTALIASRILGEKIARLRPWIGPEEPGPKDGYVYVNTVGGTAARCLSKEQIGQIAAALKERRILGLFYCREGEPLEEGEFVRRVRPKRFAESLKLIQKAAGVISPDTAAVHAASACDRPVLALYCANDPEHYGRPMREVWAPLSTKQAVLVPEARGVHRVPVSAVTGAELAQGLETFFGLLGAPRA
ncbi:MAG: hypothetical protein ACFWTZ_02120 [Burkholderia sp.]|jgi:hypothetical protein